MKRAIFVHVPKTGGTSMGLHLQDVGGVPFKGCHASARGLAPRFPKRRPDQFRFGFVRHPCDRLVSLWASTIHAPEPTFEAWMKSYSGRQVPTCWSMLSVGGELWVDFVGRFEDLESDWGKVCDGLEVEKKHELRTLPTHNGSEHGPWQSYYDGKGHLMERVERFYREDFERFGYRPEL